MSGNTQKDYEIAYEKFSADELEAELNRIKTIPDARTNVDALTRVSALLSIMEQRGLTSPSPSASTSRGRSAPSESSGPSVLSTIITVVAVIFILIRLVSAFS